MPIPSIPTLADSSVATQPRGSFQPAPGGGGGPGPTPPAGFWFDSITGKNLLGAYDVRDVAGASVVTLDAGGDVSVLSDLGDLGNDATHWRGAGTNSEKAPLSGTGESRFISCLNGGAEIHWGFRTLTTFGFNLTGWHWFSIISLTDVSTVKTFASTSTSPYLYNIPSSGSSLRPLCQIDSKGGGNGGPPAGNIRTVIRSGGGQYIGSLNIESLTGRKETDAYLRKALLEFRYEGDTQQQQIWVNGYKLGEQIGPLSNTQYGYGVWGKRNLNEGGSPMNLFGFAVGEPNYAPNPFTQADAADVRAAILSDYGIETWDGSTYPTPP